ncbi:MAG: BlaI/MecI/CopY family transcriptional regulator [bacterium]|jgi:BlaI family penicillinase repressor
MSKKEIQLSEVEWSLMKICWRRGKTTAREIYEETLKEKERGYQTIKTMLDRLVEKGALRREKFGPIYLYEPVLSRSKAMTNAIKNFASTVLDDNFSPLVAYFSKEKNLSAEEIEQLRSLIQEKEQNHERD